MPVYTRNGLIYCVYYNDKAKRVWEPFGRGPENRKKAVERDLEIKLQKARKRKESLTGTGTGETFFDVYNAYLKTKGPALASNTVDGIMYAVNTYAKPEIGKKLVSMLTMSDWHRIEKRMIARGIKNRTINTYFVYISGVITWAMEELGLIREHPWRKRKRLKLKDKFQIELFSLEEFKKIQEKAEPHLSWAMEVAYHTGVRPGPTELFALEWDHIEWKNKRIRIHYKKTDTWRWQYLPPAFIKRLRTQKRAELKEYPACPYIVSYKGKQIRSVKTTWRQAKEDAGITRRIRMYDIRHYHITHALAAGAPIAELAERVGHRNPRMIVEVYAHLAKDLQTNKPFTLPDLYK